MKSAILLSAVVLSSGVFAIAPQAQAAGIYEAPLTQFLLDPALNAGAKVGPGKVTVDTDRGLVQIEIEQDFYCPPGLYCAQMMPMPITFEATLAKKRTEACNVVVFEAINDKTPVDGAKEVIQVRDNSRN